jgi:hypothetical protein
MMGLFSQAASKVQRPRGSSLEDKIPEDTEPDDTSILFVPFPTLRSRPCFWATLTMRVILTAGTNRRVLLFPRWSHSFGTSSGVFPYASMFNTEAESAWISTKLPSLRLFLNRAACSSASRTSCHIPTSSLGASQHHIVPEVSWFYYAVPRNATIRKSVSYAFCSITSQVGISSRRAWRNRTYLFLSGLCSRRIALRNGKATSTEPCSISIVCSSDSS